MDLKNILTGTDRWSFKPALVCLLTVAVITLVCQLPGSVSFFLIPLSFLGYAVALLVILAIAIYCFIKKRPRRGASTLLLFLLPVLLWRPLNWVTEVVHLGLTVGFGVGQLGAPTKLNDGDFAAYDWSVGLAGGPNTFLIHDVTDEIAAPYKHSSNSDNDFRELCAGSRRLIGHYYICTF